MLTAKIEAILFAAGKPIEIKTVVRILGVSQEIIREAIEELKQYLNVSDSGIHVVEHEEKLQLVTNPDFSEVVKHLAKEEVSGELTRPSLETLTVIAYRGPMSKPEIEQIRGVNCTLILRNLLLRGLIEEREDVERLQPVYTVSVDLLRHLGLHHMNELPGYNGLHANERIDKMLAELASVQVESNG